MRTFLEYVAEDIVGKYGSDLSHTAVVFPNKRAALFLNEYLARQYDKPLWSPVYITISDLFRKHSSMIVGDSIKLVCELYKSYKQVTKSDETLDHFYGWGQVMLADFDDIDKNMANPGLIFHNVEDLRELDDVSYLNEQQKAAIVKFFGNVTTGKTELKERFLKIWNKLYEIYLDFNERLEKQGLAYEGGLYRKVVGDETVNFKYDRYLFIGFNLLQKVERQLFDSLKKEGKAKFYWDFDKSYISPKNECLVNNEAGYFISQYLSTYPNELDIDNADIYSNYNKKKKITYLSAPTENIQARYVGKWLSADNCSRSKAGRKTAVVMCNEGLLQTVVHCIPEEVEKVNITTGYPLSQTPFGSLLISNSDYRKSGSKDAKAILAQLLEELNKYSSQQNEKLTKDPLLAESLFKSYTIVNRLIDVLREEELYIDAITLRRLLRQIVNTTSIPFHGEPAEGVQIMGVLETRNLDFDNLLILSCNEGNMPVGCNETSFIPYNVRKAHGLTTTDHKVAIYAYYFYRLIQRANDISITYCTATEGVNTGEMSRFMLQMAVESCHSIARKALIPGQDTAKKNIVEINKTDSVMERLLDRFDICRCKNQDNIALITPSALNKYMRCQLAFYFSYVAGIKEFEEKNEDEIDAVEFGNLFHDSAHKIYKDEINAHGAIIDRSNLESLLKDDVYIERIIRETFNENILKSTKGVVTSSYSGMQLITFNVIKTYIRQLISVDKEFAPFTIFGLEQDVVTPITIRVNGEIFFMSTIGGRVDRIDMITDDMGQNRTRIIDYKTGSKQIEIPLEAIDDIFAIDTNFTKSHPDYYLQSMLYASIVKNNKEINKFGNMVSPALLFIQHSMAENYDPTLLFVHRTNGKVTEKIPIYDIGNYTDNFMRAIDKLLSEIFDQSIAFTPTYDITHCQYCPYAQICGKA